MRIVSLSAYSVNVPFRRKVTHASATRQQSNNLIIRCQLANGMEGWGEGVPRKYVTGETVTGALEQLAVTQLESQLDRDCSSWKDVIELCESLHLASPVEDPRGCYGNTLRCAIELSILDAFGRLLGEPLSAITRHYGPARSLCTSLDRVRYSAAITAEDPRSERLSALKMRLYGFRQCKVKVAVAGADDRRRLRRIRSWIGPQMDLRLDANEAWSAQDLIVKLEPLLAYRISCVEQPVPHREVALLADIRKQLPVAMMLDESLASLADAQEAIQLRCCDLFNIRLSKCGGFLRSLRLARIAADADLGYQLGCHPGETGILSAAGRHWATSVRDISYLEGSYDRHLLGELPTNEDFTFGFGGLAPALRTPGLGVTINHDVLKRLTRQSQTYQWG
jgi:muconate cycloisomerase